MIGPHWTGYWRRGPQIDVGGTVPDTRLELLHPRRLQALAQRLGPGLRRPRHHALEDRVPANP